MMMSKVFKGGLILTILVLGLVGCSHELERLEEEANINVHIDRL